MESSKTRFLARISLLFIFIILLYAAYYGLFMKGLNFFDRTGPVEFLLKSRITFMFLFALSGGLIIWSIKIGARIRALLLAAVFILFGVLPEFAGTHCFYKISSPLCAFLKPVLFVSQGNYTIPTKFFIYFNVIIGLSLVGRNLFCGWVCPLGALQEGVHLASSRIAKKKIDFRISSSVRILIFVSAMALLFTVGFNLYFDFLDPFIVLTWKFSVETGFIISLLVLLIVLAASVFFFRPYCYFICPIGFLTWLSGHFALFRVKLDRAKCSKCMACVKESGCPAIEAIVAGKRIVPDCYACGQCISKCKENALSFTAR